MNNFKITYKGKSYDVNWVDRCQRGTLFLIFKDNEFQWIDAVFCKKSIDVMG